MAETGFLSNIGNLFGGGGSKSKGSGMDLSGIGDLFGGGDSKSNGSGIDLSGIGDLFGGGESGDGGNLDGIGDLLTGNNSGDSGDSESGVDLAQILDIAQQGKNVVDQLRNDRSNGGSGSNDPIVSKIKDLAVAEQKDANNTFAAWAGNVGTTAFSGATTGMAAGPIGAIIGGAVGGLAGVGKTLIQTIGGKGKYERSADMEKTLYKELQKAGINMPSYIKAKSLATGYHHNEKDKAEEIGLLISLVNQYKNPAARFVANKLKTTDRQGGNQPIQQGEPTEWVKEYIDLRTRFELQIERLQKAIESIAQQPQNSINRAEQAYKVVAKLHTEFPHVKYKNAANKLFHKVHEAQQAISAAIRNKRAEENRKRAEANRRRASAAQAANQKRKYLYIGGALAAAIILLIIIFSITD